MNNWSPKGYTYILKCANGQFYVGSTVNLQLRLSQHRGEIPTDVDRRGAQFTGRFHNSLNGPFELVYQEEYPTIQQAFKREQQIKKWSHAKKEALINGDIELLKELSKSK